MYIVVTDRDSKVVFCHDDWKEVVKFISIARACGGEVTAFKKVGRTPNGERGKK